MQYSVVINVVEIENLNLTVALGASDINVDDFCEVGKAW